MSEATSVFDNHWNVTKISAMPHRGFNADFHGNANDGKGINATIAQREVKRRAFERRHADLVEDGFARCSAFISGIRWNPGACLRKANGLKWKGWHAYRRGLATNLHELDVPDI